MPRVYAVVPEPAHYNRGMDPNLTALRPYLDRFPVLGPRVYVDPAATVIGDVELAEDVSIWPGTILRGDVNFRLLRTRQPVFDAKLGF